MPDPIFLIGMSVNISWKPDHEPTEEEEEVASNTAENIADRIDRIIHNMYDSGGQYHEPGFSVRVFEA